MREFAQCVVLNIDGTRLPPKRCESAFNTTFGELTIELLHNPDSSFVIRTRDNVSGQVLIHEFGEVEFSGSGLANVFISFGGQLMVLAINDLDIGARGTERIKLVLKPQKTLGQISANLMVHKRTCMKFVKQRQNFFSVQINSDTRRSKTLQECKLALADSIKRLASNRASILKADRSALSPLIAELRMLLYVPDLTNRPGNYQPLLYQVANLFGSPLPVYAIRFTDVQVSPDQFHSPLSISMKRTRKLQKLMDIEEAMCQQLFMHTSKTNKKEIYSMKKLLKEYANSESPAHFDPTRPIVLDVYEANQGFNHYDIAKEFVELAQVVETLAYTLLSKK